MHELDQAFRIGQAPKEAPNKLPAPNQQPYGAFGRREKSGTTPTSTRPHAKNVSGRQDVERRANDLQRTAAEPKTYDIDGVPLKISGGFVESRIRRAVESTNNFADATILDSVKSSANGKTVVDVGAGSGNYSVYFAVKGGAEKVIAIESDTTLADILQENIAGNNLGDKITIKRINVGGRHDFPRREDIEKDAVRPPETLDSHINDLGIDGGIAVLRIGRNLFNPYALTGCQETVKKYRPEVIIAEAPRRGGKLYEKAAEALLALGYTVDPSSDDSANVVVFHKKA
jgi:hypothetical protein